MMGNVRRLWISNSKVNLEKKREALLQVSLHGKHTAFAF